MFRSKSRTEKLTEQVQEQSESFASTAAAVADQLRERVVPAVGQATENARDWARPHVEHGIEVAAPKLGSAVNGLAPKVDVARDKIVDELIPRIADAIAGWAAASAAAKDEAVSRGQGAAAVITGDAVAAPKGRKRRALVFLGLASATAAAAVKVMKRSAPKDDPWTTPIAEPYAPTPNGWASSSKVDESEPATVTESEILDPVADGDAPSPLKPTEAADLSSVDNGDKTHSDRTDNG
ncbi:MAG: hypothetical protein QOE58_314 [Actinomycetota bacterium]|nr:hypothetical protein [Actinomycetota bacterium]